MGSVGGTEPGSCEQSLGELPPVPLPIHLHLNWQCPVLHPSLGAFLSRIGSRAHLRSSFHDRKARTLKWSSQIQFSLVNWASACTRLGRGERLTRCPGVPPRLCHRLLMMFCMLHKPASGAGSELGLPGGETHSQEETVCQPDGELGTSRRRIQRPLSDANNPACGPAQHATAFRVPSKFAENLP